MSDTSKSLWTQFIQGLNKVGIAIPMNSFKIASGLQNANWQKVNYSGLFPQYTGQYDYQNLYLLADPMPEWDDLNYMPGNSFYDQYAAYLHSIKDDPTDFTLMTAKQNLTQYTMGFPEGPWPGYLTNPDLYVWWITSLQVTDGPPKIEFRVEFKSESNKSGPTLGELPKSVPDFIKLNSGTSSDVTSKSLATVSESKYNNLLFEFKAKNAQLFSISPNRWYNSAIISNYYDKIDPASALYGKELFGENGVLNDRVVSVLVTFRRELVIKASTQQQLESIHDPSFLKSSGNSIDVGGFTFEGGDATIFTNDSSSGEYYYSYKDNTNAPIIIGYQIDDLSPT